MTGARVTFSHVSRMFGRTTVLDDISFVIEPGEVVALTGPSGSGKTTLMQLLGSLDRPTAGRILVDDVDVGALRHPAHFRRNTVGFVFQLHYLLPALTARQNVELPMAAARVPHRERSERANSLLEEVGLGTHAGRLPADLSGGERQRVAIARALANNPRLVLADEPTGALDTTASQRIAELLESVRQNHGTTIVIASHDPALSDQADRSLTLVDGRLGDPHFEAEGRVV
jgi:ABC-type lipoprotein export system ATPase subunit